MDRNTGLTKSKTENASTDKQIELRAATQDDREFLLRVYDVSREIELAMVPWDAAQRRAFIELQFDAQARHYESEYAETTHDIIVVKGEPVGRLFVSRGDPRQIAILDITVLHEHRKNGIGTRLIHHLQAEAARDSKSLRVFVEVFNPSQEFFRDLGFQTVDDPGVDLRFEWRQPDAKNT